MGSDTRFAFQSKRAQSPSTHIKKRQSYRVKRTAPTTHISEVLHARPLLWGHQLCYYPSAHCHTHILMCSCVLRDQVRVSRGGFHIGNPWFIVCLKNIAAGWRLKHVILTFKSRCTMPFRWQWLTLSRICCMQWLWERETQRGSQGREIEQFSKHSQKINIAGKQTMQTESKFSLGRSKYCTQVSTMAVENSVIVVIILKDGFKSIFHPEMKKCFLD